MSNKPEIEKLRVLHELTNLFKMTNNVEISLKNQLSTDDQDRLERFVSGFKIEDWFEWIFSSLPWVIMIHGLDQQQFPSYSKEIYQVPDFLMILETSARSHYPLIVEVKRVPKQKRTLKIQKSQFALCKSYAAILDIPLVYAIYWEKLNGWTLNTPDIFEQKASCFKLPLATAFEFDCSLIMGDLSYLVPESLIRVSLFNKNTTSSTSIRHEKYGSLVSDMAILKKIQIELIGVESAAIDSMMTMKTKCVERCSNDETKLIETLDNNYMLKLSSWITRHLAILKTQPTEQNANISANVITGLMEKLGCPPCHMFPLGRSDELKNLEKLFMTKQS